MSMTRSTRSAARRSRVVITRLAEKQTGGKTKDGVGVLLGVTQVMTRNWLSEFNISVDRFHGVLERSV